MSDLALARPTIMVIGGGYGSVHTAKGDVDVPRESLDTFDWEFRQGMAARAKALGDVGDSRPEKWEPPLGTPDVHVVLTALAPDRAQLEAAIDRARPAYERLPGVSAIWRQDCHALPAGTEHFGYRDGISNPAVEGSGIAGSNPREAPLKAGEFVLGYRDELGGIQIPQPEILGHNGTSVAFRKLHQRAAAFRRYLKGQRHRPRGRGAPGSKDHGAMAQRRAAGTQPAARRPRTRRRPEPEQQLPV